MTLVHCLLCGAVLVASGDVVRAEPVIAVNSAGTQVLRFDTNSPGSIAGSVAISGYQGGPSEIIVGIDIRPANGLLYAVGRVAGATDTLRLYLLDPASGALSLIGTQITATAGTFYGVDFNPTVDRLRVVNTNDENLRINPNNGARADTPVNDTDLNPAGRLIDGVAYDRNTSGPNVAVNTTLYGIARNGSQLVTIGGINQSPSPNVGIVMNVGPLGVAPSAASGLAFEIFQGKTAFAALTVGAQTRLYSINLATGAATAVGLIGDGTVGIGGMTAELSIEQVAAIDAGSGRLFRFDTNHPDASRGAVLLAGLQGGAGEEIVALDVRPATGELFALGRVGAGAVDTLRLYRLDAISGIASPVGASITGVTAGTYYGMDFNPAADRIRVVNTGDENLRLNPDTGARADSPVGDTDLNPAGNLVDAVAYDRNQPLLLGTTLFALARSGNQIVRIGGIDGAPGPGGGAVTPIGNLGVNIGAGAGAGFDIIGSSTGYAAFTNDTTGQTGLYTVGLVLGNASLVGLIGNGASGIDAMTVLPSSTPLMRDGFE